VKEIGQKMKKISKKIEKNIYERPNLSKAGKFATITRGASGSLAFDFYITDKP